MKNKNMHDKVLVLSHKRAKQSDPRLDWFMFYNIYPMYRYIKKKEEIISSMLLTSISENDQESLRYGTKMKLVLIPMKYGAISSVITSYFKVNLCGKFKLENEYHSCTCYLSLPELEGNASCHTSFCTKPSNTPIYPL